MLTWHDFYYLDEENGWPPIDEDRMVETLCTALKPGAKPTASSTNSERKCRSGFSRD